MKYPTTEELRTRLRKQESTAYIVGWTFFGMVAFTVFAAGAYVVGWAIWLVWK